ncbi:hypothetical protein N5E30_25550, partial [Pseudomonas chengduensis]
SLGSCRVFKTSRNAELLPGLSTAPDGVQFWSYVELEVTSPWFYLQIVEDDGKEAFRSMLMVPSVPLLEQIIAAQTDHAWLEQAYLVNPGHMNKADRWMMEPLLEVSSIRDAQGNELGHQYRVESGRTYSTSASQPLDTRMSTHVIFSAALHLRG